MNLCYPILDLEIPIVLRKAQNVPIKTAFSQPHVAIFKIPKLWSSATMSTENGICSGN